MIVSLLTIFLATVMSLTAEQEVINAANSPDHFFLQNENNHPQGIFKIDNDHECLGGCNGCTSCKRSPSAADLLRIVQKLLNDRILLLPQLQPQLCQQLN